LKKKYRIKKNDEIKAVLNQRKVRKNAYFSVYASKNPLPHFRYALSVSKKFGKAVRRNWAKRRLRMILHEARIQDSVDVFIIVHVHAAKLSYTQMKQELHKLLRKHNIGVKK